jgi:amidohydrolase
VDVTNKQRAREQFESFEPRLQEFSRWMYENPEIAFEEYETSRRAVDILSDAGFTVEYPAYGLDTAFVARAGSSGPEVIVCAEMDALPEVGHACGHNIICNAGLGAGIAVAPIADDLGIRITVLGTPAEEHRGGKVDLIEAGAFRGAAASMMIHPSTMDTVDIQALAIKHIDVEFFGKESHASSAPHEGINALDAAVQAYVNVSMLRQRILDSDRLHGVITHGGSAPNVIPDRTSMSWYVRSVTAERLDVLYPQVIACFEAAARATGCTFEVTPSGHAYTDMRNDTLLATLFQQNSEAIGRPMPWSRDTDKEGSGSTDMGNVSYEVPAIHPMLGINAGGASTHQRAFAAHTITDDGMRAIRDGALAMAGTIIDLAEGDRWSELGEY